jgi:hypothetical protein
MKVILQPMTKLTGSHPDDIVRAGVVIRLPAENGRADNLLLQLVTMAEESLFADVQQERLKRRRSGEALAAGNPLHKLPTRIIIQDPLVLVTSLLREHLYSILP